MPKSKKKVRESFKFADPVEVIWRDTTGSQAWSSMHEDPLEPVTVHQLGFFLQKDKDNLHIAQGLPEADCQLLGVTVFPVGCVVSLKKVKL